ncbi:MAG: hypothetical protein M1840_000751 [Geoglossum simile]|nr:MAG: hypothetical protein M1840_000751 [Geoglossum simile]
MGVAKEPLTRLFGYSSIWGVGIYILLYVVSAFYISIMLSVISLRKGILWLLMVFYSWSVAETNNVRGICFIALFIATIFINYVFIDLLNSPFLNYAFHGIADYCLWTTMSKRQPNFRRSIIIERSQLVLDQWTCRAIATFWYANLRLTNYTLLSTYSSIATAVLVCHYEDCTLPCNFFSCSDHGIFAESIAFIQEIGNLWLLSKLDRPMDLIIALVVIQIRFLSIGIQISHQRRKQEERENEAKEWENRDWPK